jgi:hypothetical protein
MKQTRSESTSTVTGTGETKGVAIGQTESTISESDSDDSFGLAVTDDPNVESERRPRAAGWSGEPRQSVTVLIEGGGFSFNDVFPMESRLGAAQCGREIATYALSLVAHPLGSSRRRRTPGRQVEE